MEELVYCPFCKFYTNGIFYKNQSKIFCTCSECDKKFEVDANVFENNIRIEQSVSSSELYKIHGKVFKKQKCGKKLSVEDLIITKHHILPKSRGGRDENENFLSLLYYKHTLWHKFFGNKTPWEIIVDIKKYPDYYKNIPFDQLFFNNDHLWVMDVMKRIVLLKSSRYLLKIMKRLM